MFEEKEFLEGELKKVEIVYQKKKKQLNFLEELLFVLVWDVEEYEKLILKNVDIRKFIFIVKEMLFLFGQKGNFVRVLRGFRDDFKVYVKNVIMKKRQVVFYFFIFMVFDEQRKMKFYVILVCVFLYKSIIDVVVR